ncbi:hypothetical protein NB709_004114 [Xanthomonas sacchari]|nr:hypothetical protein [Xanthomonas sacchari]
MGEAVGACIEFGVGEGLGVADQGDGLWRACDLFPEQLMDQAIVRVVPCRGIEVDQQLLALGGRQYIQFNQRPFRCLLQRLDYRINGALEISQHPSRGDALADRLQSELFAEVVHAHRDRIIGPFLAEQQFHSR